MNINPLEASHDHNYHVTSALKEKKVLAVFLLTLTTMLIEIVVGTWSGSMALLADGWHMGTHAAAFAIALFTYSYARKHIRNKSFSFGTGKVNYLGGFASAVALGIVAILMAVESIQRLIHPQLIQYTEAIAVASIGLLVNVISVFILHDHHSHEHSHESHHHDHHDHNIKAAYFHVLADALTSILAIFALLAGRYFGWIWMDALMGIVGAAIISRWAYGLIKQSSAVLLDRSMTAETVDQLKQEIENKHSAIVNDLHVWTIAEGHNAAILSVAVSENKSLLYYKNVLKHKVPNLSHITVELVTHT